MGLSQTLPVTSYFKMIDIWMLFTMTIPFIEVVLHTTSDMFKKSKATQACANKQVDVVTVKPAGNQDVEAKDKTRKNIGIAIASLILLISSVIFVFIFWTIGLIVSYSDGISTDHNITECLVKEPN